MKETRRLLVKYSYMWGTETTLSSGWFFKVLLCSTRVFRIALWVLYTESTVISQMTTIFSVPQLALYTLLLHGLQSWTVIAKLLTQLISVQMLPWTSFAVSSLYPVLPVSVGKSWHIFFALLSDKPLMLPTWKMLKSPDICMSHLVSSPSS